MGMEGLEVGLASSEGNRLQNHPGNSVSSMLDFGGRCSSARKMPKMPFAHERSLSNITISRSRL